MKWGMLVASTVLVTAIASCNSGCNCNAANEKDVQQYVNTYLKPYLQHLSGAVCQLENNADPGRTKLSQTRTQCTKDGPGDGAAPPTYPPK